MSGAAAVVLLILIKRTLTLMNNLGQVENLALTVVSYMKNMLVICGFPEVNDPICVLIFVLSNFQPKSDCSLS